MRHSKITESVTDTINSVAIKDSIPEEGVNSTITAEDYEERRRKREMELRQEAKTVIGMYHPHLDGPSGPLYDPDDPELDDYPECRKWFKEDVARAKAEYEKDIEAYIKKHLEEEFKQNEKTTNRNKVQRRNSFLRKIFKKI